MANGLALIALIVAGAAILMTGSTLSGATLGFMRADTVTRTQIRAG